MHLPHPIFKLAAGIFFLLTIASPLLMAQGKCQGSQNPNSNTDDCSACIEQVFERPAHYQDSWSRNGLTPESQATAIQVTQQGTNHTARVTQENALRTAGFISQYGNDHEAALYQSGNNLESILVQKGNGMNASLQQYGHNNMLDISQQGSNLGLSFSQSGSYLQCIITQRGANAPPVQITQTNH